MIDNVPKLPSPEDEVSVEALHKLRQQIGDLEERLDAGALSFEAQQRSLLVNELKIRVYNKQLLPILAVAVIVFMAIVLWHGAHNLGDLGAVGEGQAFAISVAIVVAPVVSITSITVVLLFGSFRGFQDRDIRRIAPLAVEVAKVGASGSG